MEKLLSLCGSEPRAAAIYNAAIEVVQSGLRVTIETLAARLPEQKFPGLLPLAQDECDAAFEAVEQAANAHAAALEEPGAEPADQGTPACLDRTAAAPKLSPAEAMEQKRVAEIALAQARGDLMAATARRRLARERLANAIRAWQSGMPTVTREQAAREVIETQKAVRAARVASGNPYGSVPGPSHIDKVRFWRNKGDSADFLRKQLSRGDRRFARGDYMLPSGQIVSRSRG